MSVTHPVQPLVDASLSPTNPWKGLHFYTEADRAIFFGRQRETEEFLRLLQRDTLSVLFARSGLGKTSLLRAGVLPRLQEEGFLAVIVRVDYGVSALAPMQQVMEATLATAAAARLEVEPMEDAPQPGPETLWEFFHRHRFWDERNDLVSPVIIFDQFEEAFTLGQRSLGTMAFLEQLADLVENRMPQCVQRRLAAQGDRVAYDTRTQTYKVILSLREDYVSKLDALRPMMPAVMRNRFALGPLAWERGVEVIGQAGGQWISATVAQQIVAAVAGGYVLPEQPTPMMGAGVEIEPAYLSVMCHELFRRMLELGKDAIDADLVATEKGNILDAFYERSFADLSPATRLFVEDRLLTASGFRVTVPLADAEREKVAISDLARLVDLRLLRFEDRLGTTHVELSHDLLTEIVQRSREQRQLAQERERQRQAEWVIKQKLQRARQAAAVGAASVALLLGGITFAYFGYFRDCYVYAKDFTKQWGVPHPVGVLSYRDVAHRSSTLRITRKGWFGHVLRTEVIDANGNLTGQHDFSTYLADPNEYSNPLRKEALYEFVYDNRDRVVYEVARNRLGQMKWGFVYVPENISTPTRSTTTKAMFLGPDGYPQPQSHSKAEFVEFHYDQRGFEIERRYQDQQGHPMPGPDNAYGRRMEYDKSGRVVRIISLDDNGKPMNDERGYAIEDLEYDRDSNVVESQTFDATGKAILSEYGYHRGTQQYDQWGRQTELRFFGLSGKPTIETNGSEAHRITWEYDDRGNCLSIKLFNEADTPIVAGEDWFAFPAHELRRTYNTDNQVKMIAYFDENGQPLTAWTGWHIIRFENDNRGFLSELSWFNENGKPASIDFMLTHHWKLINDEFGQPIEERFFDKRNQPIQNINSGYHIRRNRYDQAGNLIEQTYFDANGKPIADPYDGAHRYVLHFDRFRNPVLIEYFNEIGQPVNNLQGFHKVESNYDNFGNKLSTRWYDKDGHPTNGPEGVHYISYTYNDDGSLTQILRFDIYNQPVADMDGIHQALYTYNNKKQQTKEEYFGLKRKPVAGPEGYAELRRQWSEDGKLLREEYFGPMGVPVVGPDGYHRMEEGQGSFQGKTRYFDAQNREMSSLKSDTVVSVIFIQSIFDISQPAAKAGLHAGDILWRYGNWSFPDALETERSQSSQAEAVTLSQVVRAYFVESDRLSTQPIPMTVIRNGKLVTVQIPPLQGKELGIGIEDRSVPIATFEQWKSLSAKQ